MRRYNMQLIIAGADPARWDDIKSAAESLWDFNGWDAYDTAEGPEIEGIGEDQLGGGTGEDEFARQLAEAVWNANGGPCRIVVRSTYLDDQFDAHVRLVCLGNLHRFVDLAFRGLVFP